MRYLQGEKPGGAPAGLNLCWTNPAGREFRAALVDRFSAGLLNLGILRPEDFAETPEKGVLLRREAMKTYFECYEKELTSQVSQGEESLSWRQIFRRQAERLARTQQEDQPYMRRSACHADRRFL